MWEESAEPRAGCLPALSLRLLAEPPLGSAGASGRERLEGCAGLRAALKYDNNALTSVAVWPTSRAARPHPESPRSCPEHESRARCHLPHLVFFSVFAT